MEITLQPRSTTCFVSGEPFVDGARVASFLVQGATPEILRYDVLETQAANFNAQGKIVCRWVQIFKARKAGESSDRNLKLTAESLFATLADPQTEPTPENTRLVQFLALMLERKKVLKPRGLSADRLRNVYEHAKSKQMFEVPVGELTPEFFVAVQEQLSVLVGAPKPKTPPTQTPPPRTAENPPASAPVPAAPPAEPAGAEAPQ